jgi:hypothetical protein
MFEVLDRALYTCDISPELRTSIEKQIEYELPFIISGGIDETD